MKLLAFILLACCACAAQDLPRQSQPPLLPTIVNFGLHSADAAQTCYNLHNTRGWHERMLPSQSCVADTAMIEGAAFAAWTADYLLRKHGHRKLAQFQWGASAGSAYGIWYTFGK